MFGFGKMRRSAAEPDESAIVPRIKHLNFLGALRDQGIPKEQWPYAERLIADLLVTYAFDLPDIFQMVGPSDLERLGLSRKDLRRIAIANLRKQLNNVNVGTAEMRSVATGEAFEVYELSVGNELESCMLLEPKFWNDMQARFGCEIMVAVPTRNVVVFADAGSKLAIKGLRELAKATWQEEEVHCLTKHLLVWRGGKWDVLS